MTQNHPHEFLRAQINEGGYPVVYYILRKDVKTERLFRSSHYGYWPFKGVASYFSLVCGPANVVWSHEHPQK
jgi:uncharacterized protein (DUF427 family)